MLPTGSPLRIRRKHTCDQQPPFISTSPSKAVYLSYPPSTPKDRKEDKQATAYSRRAHGIAVKSQRERKTSGFRPFIDRSLPNIRRQKRSKSERVRGVEGKRTNRKKRNVEKERGRGREREKERERERSVPLLCANVFFCVSHRQR